MLPSLFLPTSGFPNGGHSQVSHNGSVVIIGANGSGKSRLGAWIEQNSGTMVHRISAQRALELPDYTQMKSLEQSINDLLWGSENADYANNNYKWGHKYQNRPTSTMQHDFGKVLSALFAASSERDRSHTAETRRTQQYLPVADSATDKIERLWREILPHRKLVFADGKVMVEHSNGVPYLGKEMSDGEKVALYLMGQILCAPPNSILIIDEPETHLHSSIMQSMWDKLEEEKNDCLFVYITHDLNFASTRVSAANIWIKEFNGVNIWTWELIPEVSEFPDALLMELLGNRRTVVFVEGEKGGKDHSIYQAIFRNYNVVARNGCESVIESTRALRNNGMFHHVRAIGLIDRDYRSDEEIALLRDSGIYCVEVAEIENVLINESSLRAVAKKQHLDADEILNKTTEMVRRNLSRDMDRQVSQRTMRTVETRIRKIDSKQIGLEGIKFSIDELTRSINVDEVYISNLRLYQTLSESGSLDDMLRYYNNKGLIKEICNFFELGRNGYEKLILRMLNSSEREDVLAGIRQYVPEI